MTCGPVAAKAAQGVGAASVDRAAAGALPASTGCEAGAAGGGGAPLTAGLMGRRSRPAHLAQAPGRPHFCNGVCGGSGLAFSVCGDVDDAYAEGAATPAAASEPSAAGDETGIPPTMLMSS